jgi:hypothetical protein
LKFLSLFIALALVLTPMSAMAQDFGVVNVPATGYEGTNVLNENNTYTVYYNISVDAGQELVFDFRVVGTGTFSVFLSPMDDPLNYYVSFSTPQPVTSFSKTFPPNYGFSRQYFIQVNSTDGIEIHYTASIHTEKVDKNYTVYYILIIFGFVALVVFCYKYVEWQDNKEKAAKKNQRRGKRKR